MRCCSAAYLLTLLTPVLAFAQSKLETVPEQKAVPYHATIDTVKYVFGVTAPVAHLKPGNILEANSLDCFGNAIKKPGDPLTLVKGDNPLTGPFYIDGAEPGDTLVVHLNRVRLNRDTAGVFSDSVVGPALDPYYYKDLKREKNFESGWKLDTERGVAMLSKPTERLKNFTAKLQPMLGCVGVAPPNRQAFQSGNL